MVDSSEKQLPAEILQCADLRSNELAWRPSDIPAVIEAARRANLVNLGGDMQVRAPSGKWGEPIGVRVDTERVPNDLPWDARVEQTARAALADFQALQEECDFEAGWTEDLKQDSTYQLLSTNVPQTVIDHGVRRVASELSERELQPLSIALEMARFELDLKEQDIETLHKYYAEGVKLLKAERNRPTSSI